MIDPDVVHAKPATQAEAGEKRFALLGMTPAFHKTDVGEFEGQKAGGDQACVAEPACNGFSLRLTEQQRSERRGIDDLNDRHDRFG
jgi:hypothetical protein